MKIGITGNNGFIGYHLSNSITYFKEDWSVIPFNKNLFSHQKNFLLLLVNVMLLVHLAGVNRADSDEEVYETNINA